MAPWAQQKLFAGHFEGFRRCCGIFGLVLNGITVRGSIVGPRLDLQESIEFAAAGKVEATIETARQQDFNTVLGRMHKGKIEGRVVLDMTD